MSSGYEKWGTKWADFSLVVDTGEELSCHKLVLAQCSPFFEAMLSSECEETKANKMKAKDFNLETVTTFLEYLYAKAFEETFDKAKITPELMRLSHMYDVQGLYDLATVHLKNNICDSNAVGILIEAEKIKNEGLKECAVSYIAHKKEDIANLPGIDEAYKCPELMKTIFASLADLKAGNKLESIAVKVSCRDSLGDLGVYEVSVKAKDTIRQLKKAAYQRIFMRDPRLVPRCTFDRYSLSLHSYDLAGSLNEDRTLEDYGIGKGTKIFFQIFDF